MTLKKLTNDHYVIVDDSEIKVGDYCTTHLNIIDVGKIHNSYTVFNPKNQENLDMLKSCKKITHSTQPLEYSSKIDKYWGRVQPIELSEVKELIGEVDVEKKAREIVINNNPFGSENFSVSTFNGLVKDITKALEDNKEKKWTDEDVIRIVEKSRETGLTAEYVMMTFQPKTEWEVEFVDGKMKLKK